MSKQIIIFSGAGLSAESGIQTFRGNDGLWENHSIEEICNDRTWRQNFEQVHQFYNKRRIQLAGVSPNTAHQGIQRIQTKFGKNVHIITQNVDNLLEKAGCTNVLHVHGFLTDMECTACGYTWTIGEVEYDFENNRCPKCSQRKSVKPDIVFFYGIAPKYQEMFQIFELAESPETLVIVIGTDGSVVPVSQILSGTSSCKILCNLHKSDYIDDYLFNTVYHEPAGKVIDEIEKLVDQFMENS